MPPALAAWDDDNVRQTGTALTLALVALGQCTYTLVRAYRKKEWLQDATFVLVAQFVTQITMFVIGDSRATFRTVLPSDVSPDSRLVNVDNLTSVEWWHFIEWLLTVPAMVALIISLQRRVEERQHAPGLQWAMPAQSIQTWAVGAAQIMLVSGITSALYGSNDGARGFFFALGCIAGGVLALLISMSLYRAVVLGPVMARAPCLLVWLVFTLSWSGYPAVFLVTRDGWGSIGAGNAAIAFGTVDIIAKNILIALIYRVRFHVIDSPGAVWDFMGHHKDVQTELDGTIAEPAKLMSAPDTIVLATAGSASARTPTAEENPKDDSKENARRPSQLTDGTQVPTADDVAISVAASRRISNAVAPPLVVKGVIEPAMSRASIPPVTQAAAVDFSPPHVPTERRPSLTAAAAAPAQAAPPPPAETPAAPTSGASSPRADGTPGDSDDPEAAAIREEMMALARKRAADARSHRGKQTALTAAELFSDAELRDWSKRLNAAQAKRSANLPGVGPSPAGHGIVNQSRRALPTLVGANIGRPGYDASLPVHERLYGDAMARNARLEEMIRLARMLFEKELTGLGTTSSAALAVSPSEASVGGRVSGGASTARSDKTTMPGAVSMRIVSSPPPASAGGSPPGRSTRL